MIEQNKKRLPLNKDVILLLKGLLIGKVLTLVVIGGLLWWLRESLFVASDTPAIQSSNLVPGASTTESNFQTVSAVPSGSFRYGGSPAWAPIRQLVDAQIQNTRPELQLRYINPANRSPSSNAAIGMLLDGKLDIAQTSRPLTVAESAIAKQRGFTLEQHPVATDGVAVVVNPSLQLEGLTTKQLQQIYQGEITNWQQVGGVNLPITPFSLRPETADATIFESVAQQLGSNVRFVSSTTEALRKVKATPGGVYYASARAVVPQCSVKPLALGRTAEQLVSPYQKPLVSANACPRQRNQLNIEAFKNGDYPITRNLYVIFKDNQSQQQVGEAYTNLLLSEQGQKALEQAGFTQPLPDVASR